jgi:hypothetical protein
MSRRDATRARRPSLVVVVAAALALVVGCSSSPSTSSLQQKLRQVSGLSAFQAKCVATGLEHALTAKEMRQVAGADGRGGIPDAQLSQKVQKAVSNCVFAPSTTQPAPGSSGSGSGSSTVVTQEP